METRRQMSTRIHSIKRHNGVAGQFCYTAKVQYEDEDPMSVNFYGMLPRGNNLSVIMETNGDRKTQTYVTDPTRFGYDLNPDWVRSFFASA